jgi:hypothetical protein
MLTKDFNALPLPERSKMAFSDGKLIAIYEDNQFQKVFYFKWNGLKIDVIYDKVHNKLLDILAWQEAKDRVAFLRMSA